MNFRQPTPTAAGGCLAWPVVAVLLLPVLAPSPVGARPPGAWPDRRAPDRATLLPYLPVMGPTPLRFQSPEPPPPAAPPQPVGTSPPAALPASIDVTPAAGPPTPAAPASSEPAESRGAAPTDSLTPAPPAPAPLLPDRVRPPVTFEDFLGYFRFPGSPPAARELNVIIPAPPTPAPPTTLPASSATYTRTPE